MGKPNCEKCQTSKNWLTGSQDSGDKAIRTKYLEEPQIKSNVEHVTNCDKCGVQIPKQVSRLRTVIVFQTDSETFFSYTDFTDRAVSTIDICPSCLNDSKQQANTEQTQEWLKNQTAEEL